MQPDVRGSDVAGRHLERPGDGEPDDRERRRDGEQRRESRAMHDQLAEPGGQRVRGERRDPKSPSAAARRSAGANSTARVEAALKPAANARPWIPRSTRSAGPMRSTKRTAAEAAAIEPMPPSRKMRRPKRSSSVPITNTLSRPERPVIPIAKPMTRSLPPSARTWSGSRKNDAKVMKKQKFATVTRLNCAVRSASVAGGGPFRGGAGAH